MLFTWNYNAMENEKSGRNGEHCVRKDAGKFACARFPSLSCKFTAEFRLRSSFNLARYVTVVTVIRDSTIPDRHTRASANWPANKRAKRGHHYGRTDYSDCRGDSVSFLFFFDWPGRSIILTAANPARNIVQ
jgi:hypothetical protein